MGFLFCFYTNYGYIKPHLPYFVTKINIVSHFIYKCRVLKSFYYFCNRVCTNLKVCYSYKRCYKNIKKGERKKKMNQALKLLAQNAKNRLRAASRQMQQPLSAELQNEEPPASHFKNRTMYLVSSMQYYREKESTLLRKDPLYHKVKRMLKEMPDTPTAIGDMIDHKIYDALSSLQKQNYIIRLSKHYKRIKEQVEQDILQEQSLLAL